MLFVDYVRPVLVVYGIKCTSITVCSESHVAVDVA